MTEMICIGGGWMADVYSQKRISYTVEGIRRQIENNAQEQFIKRTVPELFFWDLGLEYIGSNIKFVAKKIRRRAK